MTDFRLSANADNLVRPSATGIYQMQMPQLRERFEYHPETKRVYVLRGVPPMGTSIADNILSVEEARHVVLYWSRGFIEGKAAGQWPAG